jgi:hypothetical protein
MCSYGGYHGTFKPESEESSESVDQVEQEQDQLTSTVIDHKEIFEESNNNKKRMSCTERKIKSLEWKGNPTRECKK